MEGLRPGSPTNFDLIVIGAGPAGSSAAITAAREGARVLLCERGRFPRHRVCGEFVSAESLELLSDLLGDGAPMLLDAAPRISRARLFAEGRIISTVLDSPAASIARFDIDFALWKAAIRLGVNALGQTTVERVDGDGPFRVATSAGVFDGKALINATGRWSNLARPGAVPHDRSGARWLGIKAHFSEPKPSPSVDLYFFEGGYCGVQPVHVAAAGDDGNRINACAMVRADRATTLAEIFEIHPALAERSQRWQPLMGPITTSPLVFREPAPLWQGMLLAGDSAGFVDPFVGDGISLALRSGAAAAHSLLPFLRGEIVRSEAEQRYAADYELRLVPIFRNSQRIRRLFRLPRPVRKPLAYFFEHTPALTNFLVSKTR